MARTESTARPAAPVSAEVAGLSPPTGSLGPRSRHRSHLRLVVSYVVTVFLLLTLNFFLPRAMPGDPIDALTSEGTPSYVQDEAVRSEIRAYYGLDRPLLAQYGGYLSGLARGDLGVSIRYNVPVMDLVKERLPWTLLLVTSALAIAVAVGWAAGVHSAWRRGRAVDRSLLAAFLALHSFPVFFVGSIAVLVFSVKLGWFPLSGSRTPFSQSSSPLAWAFDVGSHLVLPATVLALNFVTSQYLTMRASLVGELGADYLLLGRAKGLRERRLKYRYAGRNALLPVVTLAALHLGFAVTGSILVETVFAYKGMGRLVFEAVSFRDYPTLAGCFLVLTFVVLTLNFLVEASYSRLDPRTTG